MKRLARFLGTRSRSFRWWYWKRNKLWLWDIRQWHCDNCHYFVGD